MSAGLSFLHISNAGGAASLSSTNTTAFAGLTPVKSGVVWIGYLIELSTGSPLGFAVVNLGEFVTPFPGYGLLYNLQQFGFDNGAGMGGQALTGVAGKPLPASPRAVGRNGS